MSPILNISQVAGILGMSTRSIRRAVKAGTFPQPVVISRNIWCWPRERLSGYLGTDL